MGLSYSEMVQLTFSELMIMHTAKIRETELNLHNTRMIMWSVINKDLKKSKQVKLTDIFKLSFDKEEKVNLMSKDDFAKFALNRN